MSIFQTSDKSDASRDPDTYLYIKTNIRFIHGTEAEIWSTPF